MKKTLMESILIFTDGACSGNPGMGGWGAVICTPSGQVKEIGGREDETTNNRMEMMAAIRALAEIKKEKLPVVFYTDSTYLIRGITQWIWGWKKKGWKTAEGADVNNQELWEKLDYLVRERGAEGKVEWLYSRGHVGTPGNERCDEIAVAFSKKKWIELYEGPLLQYSIPIYDVPEDSSLPEIKPREPKAPAYSYLSLLGGTVCRHSDWASCERRVKGQSGAKFKKATSAANEKEILQEWGLSGDTKIT